MSYELQRDAPNLPTEAKDMEVGKHLVRSHPEHMNREERNYEGFFTKEDRL